MELTNIRDIFRNKEEYLDKEVTIGGWVRSVRGSKKFGFIVVNDGTFFEPLQIVYGDHLENFAEISKLNVGAAIIVTGKLVPTPEAKQPFEIQAESVDIEGASAPDYPLQKKRHTFEYLRTISHLRPRTNTFEAVFRVRSLIAYAIHKFFQERDFVYVHTPLITGSDCEGAGEMFQVTTMDLNNVPKKDDGSVDFTQDFFGKPTNLHAVWDDMLVESAKKWSYTEWQEQIDRLTDEEAAQIAAGEPADWVKETHEICKEIYASSPEGTDISYDYIFKYTPVVERQFLRGGHRLARLLNEIYR